MRYRLSTAAPNLDEAVSMFLRAGDLSMRRTAFGRPLFGTFEEAEQAWPSCRRRVWMATPRMAIPLAARTFDDLSLGSPDALRNRFQLIDLPVADVLAAIRHDRDRLATFDTEAPRAALAIADYLTILRDDLALVERQARTLAAVPYHARLYPPNEWPRVRYDGSPIGAEG